MILNFIIDNSHTFVITKYFTQIFWNNQKQSQILS